MAVFSIHAVLIVKSLAATLVGLLYVTFYYLTDFLVFVLDVFVWFVMFLFPVVFVNFVIDAFMDVRVFRL